MLLSFAVRLPGLNGELGHTPLDFDENRLGASIRTFFAKGELQHTTVEHHPGLAFWLFAASSFLNILNRMAHGGVAPAALLPVEMYVGASRIANLFVAAATVGVTAFAGRRLAGSGAGLMAGLVVAAVPLSVETTTLCRCDPVMVLGAVVTLVLALRCLTEPRPAMFAAAGAVAGAAAAIKYSGVFAIVPVLLAALALPSWRERLRLVTLATACFVAAVAVTNHYIWSDFPNFLKQLSDQIAITGPDHWGATDDPRGFYVLILGRFGTGVALLVLAAAFAVYTLATRRLDFWIAVSFPILYLAFMAGRPSQFPRWVYPMLPFVAIMSAASIVMIVERLNAWMGTRSVSPRTAHAVVGLLVAGVLAQPMWSGAVSVSRRLTAPPYARAEQRIRELAKPGEVVLLEKGWLDLLDERRDDQARRGPAKDPRRRARSVLRRQLGRRPEDPVRPSHTEAARLLRTDSRRSGLRRQRRIRLRDLRRSETVTVNSQLPNPQFPNCQLPIVLSSPTHDVWELGVGGWVLTRYLLALAAIGFPSRSRCTIGAIFVAVSGASISFASPTMTMARWSRSMYFLATRTTSSFVTAITDARSRW